ncbi:MAG: hypothetical protein ACI9DJ_001205 [Algoriphagus sp.]|jgi:hypothetical protein
MPFTLSHAVAVFPFRRFSGKYLSMTGLIAGSMAPDFEFFLRVTLYGNISHTWLGIFIFDFPVGLMIAILFHWVIKEVLIDNLPNMLYSRFVGYRDKNWLLFFKKKTLVVMISVLIGIFTHFAWDNLTHEPNYISPIYFDFLLESFILFTYKIPIYSLLQTLSSGIGILVIFFVVWSLPVYREISPVRIDNKSYWISIFSFNLILIIFRYLVGVPSQKPMGQLIVITISTFLFSLLFTSGYHKWFKNK